MNICVVCLGNPLKRIGKSGVFLYQFIRCFSSSAVQIVEVSDEDENHQFRHVQLKSSVKRDDSHGWIVKAIESLNALRIFPGRPTVHEYNQMISCYLNSAHVASQVLIELYNGMKLYGPYPNNLTFEILLTGMISSGSLRDGIFMAEEMCRSGYRPLFRSLSGLLEKSLQLGTLADSLSVLELMLKFDYYPVPSTANTFIVSLCKRGMFREAHFLFNVLLEKSREYFRGACNYSHNQILWAVCKSGQICNALAFFCYLGKKGIIYNVSSYTALVHGFCQERLWEEAFHCLSVMGSDGCNPNVITYTVIVKFLCDDGKIEESLAIVEKMEKEGCSPDLVTFNIVLRELCNQNKLMQMGQLLELIDQKGFSPNQFTYASLAGGLLRSGNLAMAKKLLLKIMSKDDVLDSAIYNIYFYTLCCEHKTDEALSLVNILMEGGFRPNNISYNTILRGICEEKRIDEALEFFNCIRWGANKPDLVSYNTMLSAVCKEGNTPMVRRLLYRMKCEGFELNVVGATSLLLYFCGMGNISECLKLLESMMTDGPNPTILTFNTLMKRLCKMRALNMAYRIFSYLRSSGLSPDTTTYNILICAYRNDNLMVSQLLTDMFSLKLKPDAATCESFLFGLNGEVKLLVALQVRDQMRGNGITPNIGIYNAILELLFKRGKFWEIVTLLKEMAEDHCEANKASYEILNKAMSKGWMKDYPRAAKHLEAVLSNKSRMNTR